jgi:hypothetical protein
MEHHGGQRVDRSGLDCRFESANPELLHARSGPGLIAPSVRDLGWIDATRIASYADNSSLGLELAALNHPEAVGR